MSNRFPLNIVVATLCCFNATAWTCMIVSISLTIADARSLSGRPHLTHVFPSSRRSSLPSTSRTALHRKMRGVTSHPSCTGARCQKSTMSTERIPSGLAELTSAAATVELQAPRPFDLQYASRPSPQRAARRPSRARRRSWRARPARSRPGRTSRPCPCASAAPLVRG